MREFIRSLSPTAEFVVVIGGAFGLFILGSIAQALTRPTLVGVPDGQVSDLLILELVLLAVLGAFLYVRGWTPAYLGLHVRSGEVLAGVGLAVAAEVAYVVASLIAALIFPLKAPVSS